MKFVLRRWRVIMLSEMRYIQHDIDLWLQKFFDKNPDYDKMMDSKPENSNTTVNKVANLMTEQDLK